MMVRLSLLLSPRLICYTAVTRHPNVTERQPLMTNSRRTPPGGATRGTTGTCAHLKLRVWIRRVAVHIVDRVGRDGLGAHYLLRPLADDATVGGGHPLPLHLLLHV
ncbi:hypothetical protein E2C01_034472 [Portunus trituberculatus]|uniref:Secreted protein n=1 Tax=Portunus trituberculatus TaxID=210409 RepID=A0A5B7F721_PORTR|nr:hypothetical protein [Portunus trituberculatus]